MRKITDEDIYRRYLGDIEIGVKYNSPLRPDDLIPSFMLYERDGVVYWNDFGLPEKHGSRAIHFVMHYKGCNETQAQRIIQREVVPGVIGTAPTKLRRRKMLNRSPILKYRRTLYDFELAYWNDFLINPHKGVAEILSQERVYGLERLSWTNTGIGETSISGDPAFVYYYKDDSWKRYRPLASKGNKWKSWNISDVMDGWDLLPRHGNLLIISSSKKDGMVLKTCGLNVISGPNETASNLFLKKKREIDSRFSTPLILFDADQTGFEGAHALSKKTGWGFMDVRGDLKGCKDIAEFRFKFGYKATLNKVRDLLVY